MNPPPHGALQYTEEQIAGFKLEFARRRKRQLLSIVPFAAVMLVIFVTDGKQPDELFGLPVAGWFPVLTAVFLVSVVFALLNWRCPACNRALGTGWSPRFCPECGVALS